MLSIFCKAQTARQFEIAGEVVVNLTKSCVGVQRVRILAQEIIVSLVVEGTDRIGIDVDTILSGSTTACGGIAVLKSPSTGIFVVSSLQALVIIEHAGDIRTMLDVTSRRVDG